MARVTKPRISPRIAAIAESATLAVDARAKALKAAGEPVIGFGAGEPDFPTPAAIVEAAVEACRNPANHRYSPTPGLPELRAAIAAKTERDSGVSVPAGQVLVTAGGKHAVYTAFQTIVAEGDACDQAHRCPYRSACVSGTCRRTSLQGEPCGAGCASGWCSGGTCAAPLGDGEACSSSTQCASAQCLSGACAPLPGHCFAVDGGR